MLLSISHQTTYRYEAGASDAAMRLRLTPPDGPTQKVRDWHVTLNDEPQLPGWTNSFGVGEAFWRSGRRVEEAVIRAEGVVETIDRAGVLGQVQEAASPRVFLVTSDLTAPDDAICDLANAARSAEGDLTTLHALCRDVHEALAYRTEVTDSATPAARVLELRSGVCQDFTHLFVTAARVLGLPCRYVAGYLHDPEIADGFHASHSWAEAHVDGLGWIGFDPTRKLCVTADYVRLSVGLDAFDAAPIRGVGIFGGTVTMHVDVAVSEGEGAVQNQSQRRSGGGPQSQSQKAGSAQTQQQ